ncbi:hypothetical protein BDZ97DRAFT_323531 [Flammula alnicola]|nr:hypothetical protein BDZ97DRAFT_323531 [Flammula alnicola]
MSRPNSSSNFLIHGLSVWSYCRVNLVYMSLCLCMKCNATATVCDEVPYDGRMEHDTVAKHAILRSRTAERKSVGDNGKNKAQKDDRKQEELSRLKMPPPLLLKPVTCSRPSHQHPPPRLLLQWRIQSLARIDSVRSLHTPYYKLVSDDIVQSGIAIVGQGQRH